MIRWYLLAIILQYCQPSVSIAFRCDDYLKVVNGKQNKINIYNYGIDSVWVAIQPNENYELPLSGGFVLESRAKETIYLGSGWAGRVWGRKNCDESGKNCDSGNCGDLGTECNGAGTESVSLAEIKFDGYMGLIFYDISIVDGYTLPIRMKPTDGTMKIGQSGSKVCTESKCTNNTILDLCPNNLQVIKSGKVVGCQSDCDRARVAWLDAGSDSASPDIQETHNKYCCLGPYSREFCANPSCTICNAGHPDCKLCPGGDPNHINTFKTSCPDAYVFANDDVGDSSGQLSCLPRIPGVGSVDISFE